MVLRRATRGWARSVKQQRAKREERTLRSKANRFGKCRAELVDFRCGETTEAVCSVENSHRSIVLATWVQMQTDREHLLEHFDRRLNMGDAGLVGPGPIARHVDAFAGSHREVLVPDDLPVRIPVLSKKSARTAKQDSPSTASANRRSAGPNQRRAPSQPILPR